MDIKTIIYISLLPITALIIYLLYRYIKAEYIKYDREETLKERIISNKKLIEHFKSYIKNTYDGMVYKDISLKLSFILQIIEHKNDNLIKNKLLEELYAKCYETGVRLKTDYNNVTYILNPLNDFQNTLVENHLNQLKEIIDA